MRTHNAILAACLIAGTVSPADAQLPIRTCAQFAALPTHSPLARAARVQGTVKANLVIDSDGTVSSAQYEGNQLLVEGVASAIHQTHFESQCLGNLELVYTFAFDEQFGDATTVKFNSPNEYIVTSNLAGTPCVLITPPTKPPLFKRLLAFFR